MKDRLPHDNRFVIVGKQSDYLAIGNSLAPEYRDDYFELLTRPEFAENKKAINVYGEAVAECMDAQRLREFMEMQGYQEKED